MLSDVSQSFLTVYVQDELFCQFRILGVVADVNLLSVYSTIALTALGVCQERSRTPVESSRSCVSHFTLYPVTVCHEQCAAIDYRLLVVLESSSVSVTNSGGQQVGAKFSQVLEYSLNSSLLPNGLIVECLLYNSFTSTSSDGCRNHGVQVSSGRIGEQVRSIGVGSTFCVQQLTKSQELVPSGGHFILTILLCTQLSVTVVVIEHISVEEKTVTREEQRQHIVSFITSIGVCYTISHDGRKDSILELYIFVVNILFQKTSQITDSLTGNHHFCQLILATSCQINNIRTCTSHDLGVDCLFNLSFDCQLYLNSGVSSFKALLNFLPINIAVGTLQTGNLQHLLARIFATSSKQAGSN